MVIAAAAILIAIGFALYLSQAYSAAHAPDAGWKPYQNTQLGITAKYPATWSVTAQSGTILFAPPTDAIGTDGATIQVGTSTYRHLSDYQNNIDNLIKNPASTTRWTDLAYEEINGWTYFKDGWKQAGAQGLEYVTISSGKVIVVRLRVSTTTPNLASSSAYRNFMIFMSDFRVKPVR